MLFFVEIHLLVSFLGISVFMGMIFRKFPTSMEILSRNFSTSMGDNFTI